MREHQHNEIQSCLLLLLAQLAGFESYTAHDEARRALKQGFGSGMGIISHKIQTHEAPLNGKNSRLYLSLSYEYEERDLGHPRFPYERQFCSVGPTIAKALRNRQTKTCVLLGNTRQ